MEEGAYFEVNSYNILYDPSNPPTNACSIYLESNNISGCLVQSSIKQYI